MRVLTGEIEDTIQDDGKDPAAKALGKKGGAARAKKMTPERRAEIARKGAKARWDKHAIGLTRVAHSSKPLSRVHVTLGVVVWTNLNATCASGSRKAQTPL
jgi:general stress protein YciG